jgi:predicted adenylyl cyclase CyaB
MSFNVEIKARIERGERIREVLRRRGAEFVGVDHQVDTYFRVPRGRLKLREGNIENYLVFYEREDKKGPKESVVTLYRHEPGSNLKEILERALGVLVVVEKDREVYYIDNIKFHIDSVEGLGSFVEIEAIAPKKENRLYQQVKEYMGLFGVSEEDMLAGSYSDMVLEAKQMKR